MKDTLQPLSKKEKRHARRQFFGTVFAVRGGWIACILLSITGLILYLNGMTIIGLVFLIPSGILTIVTWVLGRKITFTLHPNVYEHSGKLRHKKVFPTESVIAIDKYFLLTSFIVEMKIFRLIKKHEGKKLMVNLAILEQSSNGKSTLWYTPLRIENDFIIDKKMNNDRDK